MPDFVSNFPTSAHFVIILIISLISLLTEVKAQHVFDADLFQNATAPSSTGTCMSPATEFTFTNPIN